MKISEKNWIAYRDKLAAINQKAADIMTKYIEAHGFGDFEAIVAYAYSLVSTYGEAAGELACEMYDSIAIAQHANVKAAEPANTASMNDVSGAVNGASHVTNGIPASVARMVKQTGADTMLQNAQRDGAEFAWIPSGDSCAFCRILASQGWQRASRKGIASHAQHIHNNCKCEYSVRFDGKSEVEGYDPDKYLNEYNDASGKDWRKKMNEMERSDYANNADEIKARKRAEYAARNNTDK